GRRSRGARSAAGASGYARRDAIPTSPRALHVQGHGAGAPAPWLSAVPGTSATTTVLARTSRSVTQVREAWYSTYPRSFHGWSVHREYASGSPGTDARSSSSARRRSVTGSVRPGRAARTRFQASLLGST